MIAVREVHLTFDDLLSLLERAYTAGAKDGASGSQHPDAAHRYAKKALQEDGHQLGRPTQEQIVAVVSLFPGGAPSSTLTRVLRTANFDPKEISAALSAALDAGVVRIGDKMNIISALPVVAL